MLYCLTENREIFQLDAGINTPTECYTFKGYVCHHKKGKRFRISPLGNVFKDDKPKCGQTGDICNAPLCGVDIGDLEYPKAQTTAILQEFHEILSNLNGNQSMYTPDKGTIIAVGESELILPGPYTTVEWLLMKTCNYDCSYCNQHDMYSPFLTVQELQERFMKRVLPADTDLCITLTGGEPTLNAEIHHLIKWLPQYNNRIVKVQVETNGSAKFHVLARLIDSGADLLITLHNEYITAQDIEKFNRLYLKYPLQVQFKTMEDAGELINDFVQSYKDKIKSFTGVTKKQYPKFLENNTFNRLDKLAHTYYNKT